MRKSLLASLLIAVSFTINAQWNLGANNYSTGNLGIGMSAAPASNKLEVHSTNDISLLFLRQDKNSGGSGDVIFFRDDRGYAGIIRVQLLKLNPGEGLDFKEGPLSILRQSIMGFIIVAFI